MSRVPARLRNRLRRLAHGIPADVVHPVVADDVYQAHLSLFDFMAAFSAGRSVLFIGEQSAFGAAYIRQRGASAVTGVIQSSRARRFAEKNAPEWVTYGAAPPQGAFDVVIRADGPYDAAAGEAALVAENGKLLLSYPPHLDGARMLAPLQARFGIIRRFAHVPLEPLDLASPETSTLTPMSFRWVEVAEEERAPANTITMVAVATNDSKWREIRLHVGSGPVLLPGWINIDNLPYSGIDFLWDAARGIPFRNARFVFAEHFIEHLSYSQARDFVAMARTALRDDGVLRMSTPNLDWVWELSYRRDRWKNADDAIHDCFDTNRAFRGWGHQFLYNFATLAALLRNSGFAEVRQLAYAHSDIAELRGLEHHQQYPDSPDLPHVVVVEAQGRATPIAIEGAEMIAEYERDVAVR